MREYNCAPLYMGRRTRTNYRHWRWGLRKILGLPVGGGGELGSSQILGLGGTPEKRHETCQKNFHHRPGNRNMFHVLITF